MRSHKDLFLLQKKNRQNHTLNSHFDLPVIKFTHSFPDWNFSKKAKLMRIIHVSEHFFLFLSEKRLSVIPTSEAALIGPSAIRLSHHTMTELNISPFFLHAFRAYHYICNSMIPGFLWKKCQFQVVPFKIHGA